MTPSNRIQALLPEGAEALPNPIGTAPGIWMTIGDVIFVAVPGVPGELKQMVMDHIVPRVKSHFGLERVIRHRVIHLFGRGEAEIESQALDLTARGRVPEVGITASDATISFRITAEGASEKEADALIEPTARLIHERFGELIIGEGETDMPDALVAQLIRTGSTIAVAESCTGGLIAKRLTDIAGVSAHFLGGVVSYANQAKVTLLGVPEALIEAHGAVSPEVAMAMASGVRERLGASLGLSVTGIAGPAGGSAEKPVGLVYLGLAHAGAVAHKKLLLGPEQPRSVIRSRAAKYAMNWARQVLAEVTIG
jgi:nicotinamide-nucleotide amidase